MAFRLEVHMRCSLHNGCHQGWRGALQRRGQTGRHDGTHSPPPALCRHRTTRHAVAVARSPAACGSPAGAARLTCIHPTTRDAKQGADSQ